MHLTFQFYFIESLADIFEYAQTFSMSLYSIMLLHHYFVTAANRVENILI